MGIGAYRHRVTFQQPTGVLDPATWDCSLQSAATQVIDGLSAFYVRGRYHPGITLETQLNFEGRTFQVQSVTDLDERHTELQLMCVEVVGRGTTPGGAPVAVPPTLTTPPVSSSITSGQSVTLTVIAAGTPPLAYQWTKAGVDIAGATNAFFVTGPLTVTTSYAVRVSNAYGAVTSLPVTVTVAAGAPTYQDLVLADGPVAYWPLDDVSGTTAHDLAGTRHGTISGGVTLNQPGFGPSKAMIFDGLTGQIALPPIPSITPAHTFEGWVFMTRGGDFANAILLARSIQAIGGFEFMLAGHSTVAAWSYMGYRSVANVQGPQNLLYGVWFHLVATYDGTTSRLYVNGAPYYSIGVSFTDGSAATPLTIGRSSLAISNHCTLQDIAVYLRALTPAEISAHFALRA